MEYEYDLYLSEDPEIDEGRYKEYQESSGPLRLKKNNEFPKIIRKSFEDSLDNILNYDKRKYPKKLMRKIKKTKVSTYRNTEMKDILKKDVDRYLSKASKNRKRNLSIAEIQNTLGSIPHYLKNADKKIALLNSSIQKKKKQISTGQKNDEKMSRISILSTLGNIKSPILIKKAVYNPLETQSSKRAKNDEKFPELNTSAFKKRKPSHSKNEGHNHFSFKKNSALSGTIGARKSKVKLPDLNTPKDDARGFQKFRLAMEDLKSSYEPPSLSSRQKRVLERIAGEEAEPVKAPKPTPRKEEVINPPSPEKSVKKAKPEEVPNGKETDWIIPTERIKMAVAAYKEEIIKNRKPLQESL
ncbi:unnamed protein product [Moneuplotes crassus]|uniref:Uncharacterized protein n=1 Tax=Euplotes crassus TaxID=5936 RepID=A0AAD1XEU8_EUPCR|nr:unnamed protein product [Moneuplotes crassus]